MNLLLLCKSNADVQLKTKGNTSSIAVGLLTRHSHVYVVSRAGSTKSVVPTKLDGLAWHNQILSKLTASMV